MDTQFRKIAFLLITYLAILFLVRGFPAEQSNVDCRTSADCGFGECCVLGMMRYSTPQCLPLGQVDSFCREDNVPENRTLYYPNNDTVDVYDIYIHVCPCDSGLECMDNSCTPEDNFDSNYIY